MRLDDIIDLGDLSPEDEARVRRAHELLLEAGPPPDLSPALARPPEDRAEEPPEVPLLFRRRRGLTAVLALAATIAAFAGGYAFGHGKAKPEAFAAQHVVSMHGAPGTRGVIQVGASDSGGNWPMLVEVTGLAAQSNPRAYYELWLTRNGKPVAPCGSFRVTSKTTRVRLTVPYLLHRFDGWVVTKQPPSDHGPGTVVLAT